MDKLEIYNKLLKIKLEAPAKPVEPAARVFKTGATDTLSTRGGGVWHSGASGGAKKIEPHLVVVFADYDS